MIGQGNACLVSRDDLFDTRLSHFAARSLEPTGRAITIRSRREPIAGVGRKPLFLNILPIKPLKSKICEEWVRQVFDSKRSKNRKFQPTRWGRVKIRSSKS